MVKFFLSDARNKSSFARQTYRVLSDPTGPTALVRWFPSFWTSEPREPRPGRSFWNHPMADVPSKKKNENTMKQRCLPTSSNDILEDLRSLKPDFCTSYNEADIG